MLNNWHSNDREMGLVRNVHTKTSASKFLFFLVFFVFTAQTIFAQWGWGYNPYMQGSMQGQQMAEQLTKMQQNAYNQGKVIALNVQGKYSIVNGKWDDALRYLVDAANEDSVEGWYWCGVVREVYYGEKAAALRHYKVAANKGNISAKQTIQRINSSGYWGQMSKYATTFVRISLLR